MAVDVIETPQKTFVKIVAKGPRGATGDVTPEALAAKEAAEQAATTAGEKAGAAATSASTATGAATQAEAARDAAMVGAGSYPDEPSGRASVLDGEAFKVQGHGDIAAFEYRRIDASTSTLIATYPSTKALERIQSASGKNILDKLRIRRGHYFSASNNAIIASPSYRCSGFMSVEAGKNYVASGIAPGQVAAFFTEESDTAVIGAYASAASFVVPTGARFAVINITNSGQDDTSYDDTAQVEEGRTPTEYEPFQKKIGLDMVRGAVGEEQVFDLYTPNLFNPGAIDWTRRLSPSSGNVVAADANPLIATGPVEVAEGSWYAIGGSALPSSPVVGVYSASGNVSNLAPISLISIDGGFKFQIPEGLGAKVARINLIADVAAHTVTGQLQMNPGETLDDYSPYGVVSKIKPELLPKGPSLSDYLARDEIVEERSFNLLDPSVVDYVKRYSTGNKAFQTDTLGIAASGYIPVEEGEWYTASGVGIYGANGAVAARQGGYFTNAGAVTAVDNIAFVAPVTGDGAAFQVPVGMGITHVVISLRKAGDDASASTLYGNVQLERGEMATAYQPYELKTVIKESVLPRNSGSTPTGGGFDAAAWYKFTEGDEGQYLIDKLPNFRAHWMLKDKDLCVVNTGTSLTARSAEHCTEHPSAKHRPPLMHSRNLASILWDRIQWEGQQYRRYDADGFFTEAGGTFSTSSGLAEWDDGPYRQGWTRYSEVTGAQISFVVPVDAWQFNLIFRTDTTGVENCTVSIAEGNGQMQAYDDATSAWVEANGYVFSMREAPPLARDILVPRASTGEMVTRNIHSKGNTTYQKRLKMRCRNGDGMDSRTTTKSVTVAGQTTGRFMYWGVEWSPREFMITYINAARGSHNTQADTERGLPKWQDNEIWSFKPDLLFFELPIHNDGAAAAGSYTAGYWGRLTDHFVFREDYELSLKSRGNHFGLSPEIGMFTSSISWNFGGINDDGTLKFGPELTTGKMMTALDKFTEAHLWVLQNHPEAVCINAAQRWVDAGVAIFGDMKSATVASGKAGNTFTNEGSHWNDTGCKIIGKTLMSLFNFTI